MTSKLTLRGRSLRSTSGLLSKCQGTLFVTDYLFRLHTGRTLTWFAVEQGFRSIKEMLQDVPDLVISEVQGKTYVQKKPVDAVVVIVQDVSHPEDP